MITAIIPIKHYSSRIPGKNYRLMDGKPLYFYILETLVKCKSVDKIVVDTDSEIIREGIENNRNIFPNIIIYNRREELRGSEVSTNKLLCQVIEDLQLNSDIYLHTHVTNPLIKVETIEKIINFFINNCEKYDSLFTVNKYYSRFYDKSFTAMNHNPENLIPTQDLDPIFEENSCLYLTSHETILKYRRRIGNNPYLFPISKLESQDIDWEDDFILAETLIKQNKKIEKKGKNKDKIILITGVYGGIGMKIAEKFSKKSWYVIGTDIKDENYNIKYINKYIKCDISDEESIKILANKLNLNRLDCLVNNAAVQLNKKLINTEIEEWNAVINCNLRPVYLLSKIFHESLKQSRGSIINISSVHAINTSHSIAVYATAKGAMLSLTRAMAIEFGSEGIRVNAILPGATDTPMLRDGLKRGHTAGNTEDDLIKNLERKHIQNRIGKSNDIAEGVYFLANPKKSGFILGHGLVIDGGATIRLSTE